MNNKEKYWLVKQAGKSSFLSDVGGAVGSLVKAPLAVASNVANKTVMPMASSVATSAAQPIAKRMVEKAVPGGRMTLLSPLGKHNISNLQVRPEYSFKFKNGIPSKFTTLNISLDDEITLDGSKKKKPPEIASVNTTKNKR